MSGEACKRPGCGGAIEDGYCNLCGHAAVKSAAAVSAASARESAVGTRRPSAAITTGTGSTPIARASAGTRRTSHSSSRTTRKQLGAGLVTLPDLPSVEPERAVMLDPTVPERKRFCSRCDAPLKREAGFCGKCGMKYSFIPSLRAGDVVAGQYSVKGPIAFGGLGWIYLAFDTLLSRYVVLKGLLNTQDESAASAAMAERQFLAAVKHPNIVGIYNFVQFGAEGFIVMEYVGGKTLKQIRQERGPLPADEAIAYIHRILPCFGYLHRLGLVYCDFKPDNVMMERDDVKLIDLGGVRRLDDAKGDIYGTVGYSAPEAGGGPTPASDLYTVGRTLAVLLTDIRGFSSDHRYSLPSPAEEPKFAGQESLYRFLLKSTAENADDRFETADEMAEQLLGVLREVVAVQTGTPRPSSSQVFGTDLLALDAGSEMEPVEPQYKYLPMPAIDIADSAAQAVSSASATAEPSRRVAALQMAAHQFPKSREARLRLAEALSDVGEFSQAEDLLKKLAEEDAWDWRVLWFQGRMKLVQAKPAEARKLFDQVYFDLPGEIAPKLALALSAELHGDLGVAAKMYDLVSRTDPTYASAAFGLARCHFKNGDRTAAVAALDRIPQSSALYLRARVEATRMFVRQGSAAPKLDDLVSASSLVESLSLEEINRLRLTSQIFTAAVAQASAPGTASAKNLKILGRPVEDRQLRLGLESSLRGLARFTDGEERIHLVDQANQVRPMTLI
jgi:serine/threonine-protein kinase PknG